MIEEGITKLVQADPGVQAICTLGGWLIQLPDGTPLPSWTYLIVSLNDQYCLDGTHGYARLRLQIDCYGDPEKASDSIRLARAINNVLSGFKGTLDDVDQTIVYSCFRTDLKDEFNDTARNYRRTLEYELEFSDTLLGE